ncbi:hypothetical protein L484_021808 [Morus notabilis]|uniref:Uncharacterized protein n=1 Tax=Morus notabilis TaxID=981085 RepID=W9QQ63_9ROSA|nr:hypothetical protein L484_021808 [Morus notabilis]
MLTSFWPTPKAFGDALKFMLQSSAIDQYHGNSILLPPLPEETYYLANTAHNRRKRKTASYFINIVDFSTSHYEPKIPQSPPLAELPEADGPSRAYCPQATTYSSQATA